MAESQKGPSSSVDPVKKPSLLDEEIGNDFLSSWKSMSMTDDDPMDLKFETVAKGKKKTFNFDKLDMDFSLDGDFGKISSFNVDLPDLEFSCSPKRTGKLKEKSEEEPASRKLQEKQEHFTFSFNFNELDSFNFGSSLIKGEKKFNECQDSKPIASDKIECQGSGNHLAGGFNAFDDSITRDFQPLESGTTLKAETLASGFGNPGSRDDNCSSILATVGNQVVSLGTRTPEKAITISAEEKDRECRPSEETISAKPYAQQTIPGLPVQSVPENNFSQDTVSELHSGCSLNTKVHGSSGVQKSAHSKTITGLGSNNENIQPKSSALDPITELQCSYSKSEQGDSDNNVPLRFTDGPEPAHCNLDPGDALLANVPKTNPDDIIENLEKRNSTSEPLLPPLSSGQIVDSLTPTKEEDIAVKKSNLLKKSEENESKLCQSSTCTNYISCGINRIGNSTKHLTPADNRREDFSGKDAQIRSKAIERARASELTKVEPALQEKENNVKDLCRIGGDFNIRVAQKGSKLDGNSRLHAKGVTKGECDLPGSEKKVKDLKIFRAAEQTKKPSKERCVNPKFLVSSMASSASSKILSIDGRKLPSLKAGKKMPDSSGLISRTVGTNNDLSNCNPQKETSLRNSERGKEVQGNVALRTDHLVSLENQKPPTLSLKRKTYEGSSADSLALNPKRLSESPKESRNSGGNSKRFVGEQVGSLTSNIDRSTNNGDYECPTSKMYAPLAVNMAELEIPLLMENVENVEACTKQLEEVGSLTSNIDRSTNNGDYECPTSKMYAPQAVNMAELETPLLMESDENVEKAEACTKQLEEICNMLKKKHEEAKEILVRAIVNNNYLLMLNHIIYEEKIRMVQKFATELTSKELHT